MSYHKHAQNDLLKEIHENISMFDNKTSSLQETISSNYSNLNDQFREFQNQEFVTDRKLKPINEWNRINNQYNDTRQINKLADAERKAQELVERLKQEIDQVIHELIILSELVKDVTNNAGEIELLKHQVENIRKKALTLCL